MLLVSGLNHKTAPLAVREACVFTNDIVQEPLRELIRAHDEVAVLSTCNRTEIYYRGGHPDNILNFLQRRFQSIHFSVETHTYTYRNTDAVRHLLRVASGLDSAALGEPQILGQLKQAYQCAQQAGTLGKSLHRLFQYAFSVTKHVRTQTGIGQHPISIAYAAIQVAKQKVSCLAKRRVLLIGAGQTAELVARYLHSLGVSDLVIANRDVLKAAKLTQQFGGQAACLGSIPYHLNTADVVITAVQSSHPLIERKTVEEARSGLEKHPLLLIDLALPRNISPDCTYLPNISLYALDDLQAAIASNISERQEAAKEAETLIDVHVEAFMAMINSLEAVNIIRAYREKMEETSNAFLLETQQQIAKGENIENALASLTHRLRNTLLHAPSVLMRELGKQGDWELLNTLQTCFAPEISKYDTEK
ncbi:MAG: glutamyl-tRNA reductase [Gammaproteobacteria bacterium]|jgi:glutamyl-tRNA reductase|nr:glutamyl-tRNA reductase [Gammaproteobacteria bacterium]